MHKGHAVWSPVYTQCETLSLDQFWALFVRAHLICHTMKCGTMKYQCHEIRSYGVEKYKIRAQCNYTRCVSSHRFDSDLDVSSWGSACRLGVSDLLTASGNLGSEVKGASRYSRLNVTAYFRCPGISFLASILHSSASRSPLCPTCLPWIPQVISSCIMCVFLSMSWTVIWALLPILTTPMGIEQA